VNFDPMKIVWALLTVFIVMNIGLVLRGLIAKIYARAGKRIGMRWYQPYFDFFKNYSFRTSISHGVMFYLGPVFRLTGGVGMLLFMPTVLAIVMVNGQPTFDSSIFGNFSAFSGDIVLVSYFMFFGTLGMAMGAGEAGHPYSAIGIARGLAQMTVAEIPLILAIMAVMIQYNTLSITDIVVAQQGGFMNWTMFTNPLATVAAMLAFLGAMGRSPFDVVMAPQEIPVGPPVEYHSSLLAVLQTNRAIFPVAKTILFMNLFFGGVTDLGIGIMTGIPALGYAVAWVFLVVKCFFIYMWSVLVGVVFPRFRPEQAIRWFMKVPFAIGLLAIIITSLNK